MVLVKPCQTLTKINIYQKSLLLRSTCDSLPSSIPLGDYQSPGLELGQYDLIEIDEEQETIFALPAAVAGWFLKILKLFDVLSMSNGL
jgi:hypothetical protein